MFIDSHCHLNLLDLANLGIDLAEVLQQARAKQVEHVLSVATDLEQHSELLAIAREFSMVKLSAGLHPEHAPQVITNNYALFDKLVELAMDPLVVGIGETGLDYYHLQQLDHTEINLHKSLQRTALIQHIHAAIRINKPLIIHSRMAPGDTIDLLTKECAGKVVGVMHCFTESWELAKKCLDLGFYISFSGIITFNKKVEDLLEIVKKVPLDRILIETDSPYLAPVPYRGKQNQPSYIPYIAAKIAEVKNLSLEEVALATSANYAKLFNVKIAL